jgi:hypothetical protein
VRDKKIVAALLTLPLLAVSFYGCAPRDISFVSLAKQVSVAGTQHTSPQLQVMTRAPVSHISGLTPEDDAKLRDTDYSQYWAVIVSFGLGADDEDNINSISQQENVVYIRAEMLPLPEGDLVGDPYEIVRIKKTQMPLNGATTFKLMDQSGKERAAVIQDITP